MSNANNRNSNSNANANSNAANSAAPTTTVTQTSNANQKAPQTQAPQVQKAPPAPAPQGPKFVWIVRPVFSVGECRAYSSEEKAFEDFGRPKSEWEQLETTHQIAGGPSWDLDNATWELEKMEIR